MPTENTTANRGYQLPATGNYLSFDLSRLIAALNAIDSDVATLVAQLADQAGLTSPAFEGIPTAPTAAPGTNTQQIATTAFVAAAAAAIATSVKAEILDAPPDALDTLNELSAALGDDPNFATTITTLIGTKLAASSVSSWILNNLLAAADQAAARTALDANNASKITSGTLPSGRIDDTSHGNRGGGSLHAAATTGANGFMSSADKSKLNGIATGANATPALSDADITAGTGTTTGSITPAQAKLAVQTHGMSVYTGSNANETDFPVGHIVLCNTTGAGAATRNSSAAVYLHSSVDSLYTENSGGASLSGVWRHRGKSSDILMQRTA